MDLLASWVNRGNGAALSGDMRAEGEGLEPSQANAHPPARPPPGTSKTLQQGIQSERGVRQYGPGPLGPGLSTIAGRSPVQGNEESRASCFNGGNPNQPGHKGGGELEPEARPHCPRRAGRDRVVTRGRGICLPSVLLPPSATTSYHKKVTSVAKEQRGMRGFSFRESASPEAEFPRMIFLGSSVNRGNGNSPEG
jgi:hypothetical protein